MRIDETKQYSFLNVVSSNRTLRTLNKCLKKYRCLEVEGVYMITKECVEICCNMLVLYLINFYIQTGQKDEHCCVLGYGTMQSLRCLSAFRGNLNMEAV
jgi:hypothetical protein